MRGRWWEPLLLGLWAAAAACGAGTTPVSVPFQVTRVQPPTGLPAEGGEEPLFLNQEITVRFNRAIEPLSVTEDTVRVTDSAGHRVKGQLRSLSHSVTFVPVAPLRHTLDDGSFKPGEPYALEVVGFPRANAVRSADGEVLDRTVTRRFRAVDVDAAPSPLLHSPTSPFGFALDERTLRRAGDSRVVQLYFHEQPNPTTVTERAFALRVPSDTKPFAPAAVKLLSLPPSYSGLPGWMIELELDRDPGDYLCVMLVNDPAVMLRDNTGAPPRRVKQTADGALQIVDLVGELLYVPSYPGTSVPLLREDFTTGPGFRPARAGVLSFEIHDGRAVPRVRKAAGTGRLGVFRPQRWTELIPGQPFDRGDGTLVVSDGGVFDFADVVIPEGVTVRLRGAGDAPVRIRSTGAIVVEGELVLDSTPWTRFGSVVPQLEGDLIDSSQSLIVAADDIVVRGSITRRGAPTRDASPVTLLCGGEVSLSGGKMPSGSVIAIERGRFLGEAQGDVHIVALAAPMARELPVGVTLRAEAFTDWYPLPHTRHGGIEIKPSQIEGDLRLKVQLAPPDSINPMRPSREGLQAELPVPLSAPISVPPGGFVRFRLEADVDAARPLPAVGGITVLGT